MLLRCCLLHITIITLYMILTHLRCFPVNFAKFLIRPFFTEYLRWLLLRVQEAAEQIGLHIRTTKQRLWVTYNKQGQVNSKDGRVSKHVADFQYLGPWLNVNRKLILCVLGIDGVLIFVWQKHAQQATTYL